MTRARIALASAATVAAALAVACTDAYLLDPAAGRRGVEDRAISVRGQFCTEPPSALRRPVKILFAMDTSQSMAATDPEGTRAKALVEVLDSLPQSPEYEVAVMLFAGDVLYLTNGGVSGFVPLVSIPEGERQKIAGTILSYAWAGAPGGANRDTTDFLKPLDDIFATISRDIAVSRDRGGNAELSRYAVVFLSDGHPRVENAPEALQVRCEAIHGLSAEAAEVALHTVFAFAPVQPIPTSCPADGGACQETMVQEDAERLRRMAEWGGGEFRSFRNGEPVNFLSLRLGGVQQTYRVAEVALFNLNAAPESEVGAPDSDADGLADARELELGTDPLRRDTDTDGYSDGVEQHFRERGAPFNPVWAADGRTLDKGCLASQAGLDADHDGLLDCDEQLLGCSSGRVDSDFDGLPDLVEWLGRAQPAGPDAEDDPDRDGIANATEVRMHTDPLVAQGGALADRAYRYRLEATPYADALGRVCYAFAVDNVLLVPTLDTGAGAGANQLLMSVAQVGAGDREPRPIYRIARFQASYPRGGIKDPPDGVIALVPEDFKAP